MESRGNDPSVSMWVQAGEKEWSGIVGRNCFLHDLTKADLVRKGVLPKKRIVGMRMLWVGGKLSQRLHGVAVSSARGPACPSARS